MTRQTEHNSGQDNSHMAASLFNDDYDPMRAVESGAGFDSDDGLEDDDGSTPPADTSGSDEGDDADTTVSDDDSGTADSQDGSDQDGDPDKEGTESAAAAETGDTAGTDTSGDEPDEELIPGVDPKDVRANVKEKTTERIRGLLSQNKDLEQRLTQFESRFQQLQNQQQTTGQTDAESAAQATEEVGLELDSDAIKQMFDKAIDGDVDTASQTFVEMMQNVAKNAATTAAKTATEQTRSSLSHEQQLERLNETVDQLTVDYPILDPQSQDFDQAVATDVRDLRDFYIEKKGMQYDKALQAAAQRELTARGIWGEDSMMNEQPEKSPEPKVDPKEKATERNKQEAARKTKVDQPSAPRTKTEGGDDLPKSIMDLSDDEFDKLTDAQLEKMTGTQYS